MGRAVNKVIVNLEKFQTEPRPYQLEVYKNSKEKPYYGMFLATGLGKTKIVIDTASYLYHEEEIYLLVVIAPKGMYEGWVKEIEIHLDENIARNTVVWKSAPNRKTKAQLNELLLPNFGTYALDIFIGNIDMLSTRKGVHYLEQLLTAHGHHTLMVIDESTDIGSRKAIRTKAAIRLGRLAKYRRILTGTPIADSIMELPMQISFLGDLWELLGARNWYTFRSQYCILELDYFGGRTVQRVVGTRRMDKLLEKLNKFCSIISKEQANPDLPPQIYQQYMVEMTPGQKKYYRDMQKKCMVELKPLGQHVAVNIVLAKIMKLRQIAAGFFYDDVGQVARFPHTRIDGLFELFEKTSGKIIIWSNFIPCIDEICTKVGNTYGQGSFVRYDGSAVNRPSLVEQFTNDDDCRFFIGNQTVGKFGITLTAAETMIFYTNSYSYKTRIQAEGRSSFERRATQGIVKEANKSTLIIDMVASGTIDVKLLEILNKKEHVHNSLMNSSLQLIDLIKEEID